VLLLEDEAILAHTKGEIITTIVVNGDEATATKRQTVALNTPTRIPIVHLLTMADNLLAQSVHTSTHQEDAEEEGTAGFCTM